MKPKRHPKLIPFEQILDDLEKEHPGSRREIERKADEYIKRMEIRELRESLKVSQAELSRKSGVSRAKISKIENGQQNATLKTLNKLSNALGKKMEIVFR